MNKSILLIFKDATRLLVKRPIYIFLGFLAYFPGNIPVSVRVDDIQAFFSFLSSLPLIASLSSQGNSNLVFLLFLCLGILLWLLKITAFSYICLDILSQKRKGLETTPRATLRQALLSTPRVALLRITGFLFFALFLYLLILPVHALAVTASVFSAWFLGLFALAIFFWFGASFASVFFFAHFYVLFARLSLSTSFRTAATLFLKHEKLSLIFMLWIGIFFLLVPFLLAFLPGFETQGLSLAPLFPTLSPNITFAGFFLQLILLLFLSALFPVAGTLFFLRIAKKKKKRKAVAPSLETILSPIMKRKSETAHESK